MKTLWLKVAISVNLLVLVGLAFAYPGLMVSPGPLMSGHTRLSNDCFACHTAWVGATAEKCVKCHAVKDIGVRTTTGLALPADGRIKVPFHQDLAEQNCVACHQDHPSPRLAEGGRRAFQHGLLRPATREQCETCHASPSDARHQQLATGCARCHQTTGWKPASFDHALLAPAVLERCEGCHKTPTDSLHERIQSGCPQCHSPKGWKPATFDHSKSFVLDRDHNASCATCHEGGNYKRYTCYGCHEHTPGNILAEHEEEGISDLENCVRCHRSGDKDSAREGSRERRGREGDRKREQDDERERP